MPRMHTLVPTLAVSLLLASPLAALAAAPAPGGGAPSVTDALPYARQLVASGLGDEKTEALAHNIDQLITRLMLDDQHAAIDRPTDLHALMMLAAEVQLLDGRGEDGPALRRAALSTAYMLHMMGHAYETRQSVRTALDALPDQVSPERKATFDALVESVRRMRRFGDRWFAYALPRALKDDPQSPAVQDQRGLWLLREGHPKEAAAAFAVAFRKSEQPRHALNLYDALLAAGEDDEAAQLAGRLVKAAPALEGQIDAIRVKRREERATAAWEAAPQARYDDVAGCVAQLRRYWRLDREGATILLGKRLEADHFDDAAVQHAVAETWLATRKMDALEALLARAAAQGPLDSRLTEARIAWAVQRAIPTTIPTTFSTASGPPVSATLDADLDAIATQAGERGQLVRRAAHLLIPIGIRQAALAAGHADPDPALAKRFEAAIDAGLKELPRSLEMRLLTLAGYVAFDRALDGVKRASQDLDALSGDDRRTLTLLLAQVSAGYAVRTRDDAALAAAAKTVEGLAKRLPKQRPAGWDEPAWKYTRAVLGVARATLDGGGLPAEQAKRALAALPRPLVDFDTEDGGGRLYAIGLAATRGTLLLALDEKPEAIAAFGRLRYLAPDEPVAKIVGAQVQLMLSDANSAWELLSDGMNGDLRPSEAFAARKWRAITARVAGEGEAVVREAQAQLDLWDVARMPEVIASRSPRALFIGDFNVGLMLLPDEPLRVEVRATPIVLLIPDAPQTRDEVRALATPAK